MIHRGPKRKGATRRIDHGAPPGTLTAVPEAPKPVVRVLAYGPDEFTEAEVDDMSDIAAYRRQWPVTWVNVDGLGDADVIRCLGEVFGLHPLALEDVLHLHQRPKVEEYDDHLFLVVRMLEEGSPVSTEQLSIFIGEGFVLTFQEHVGDCLDPVRTRIREGRGRVRAMGADYLGYALVDAIVDGYYPFLDDLSEQTEALEEEVLKKPASITVMRIHQFKRDLLTIRRVMSSLREALNTMVRDGAPPIKEETRVYFRDCYDHTIQIMETVETHRDVVGGLLDVYLSSVSNRMNEVMKVLTIIATMFIPLTFLAGIYGMNFNTEASPWNLPELGWYWGYPAFIVICIAVLLLEVTYFRYKRWL